jgi:uracil-DNA glycosylase
LVSFLKNEEKARQVIYPPENLRMRALQAVDYSHVRVVILGQDPYHGPQQAIGLSFGVPNSLHPKPPSLTNIFKEIQSDLGVELPKDQSDLTGWAEQGVLLLNTVLSVRKNQAFSHRDKGWEILTDKIIRLLNDRAAPVIFLLWGSAAMRKQELISSPQHFVLTAPHPSPLSAHRGFLGCKHFSRVNQILADQLQLNPIDWARLSSTKASQ